MLTTEQSRFFSTSVQLLLTNWFALKTAVEQGWGGRRSNEKAHAFIQEIIDLLLHQGSKGSSSSSTTMLGKINEFELQAFIEEVMNTEFCCLLEDDSAYLLSKTLSQLYLDCQMNQFQVVQEIHTKYAHKPNLPLVHSRKETSESDSDSSGTDSENEEEDESSSNIESDTSSTLLMDVDESQMQQEHFVHTERPKKQSIDDDGFILVQKNGKHYQPRSLDDP